MSEDEVGASDNVTIRCPRCGANALEDKTVYRGGGWSWTFVWCPHCDYTTKPELDHEDS